MLRQILDGFLGIVADPYRSVAEAKARYRKKVIGCCPMNIPEEFIHAAGMLPVVMWRSNEPITSAHAHMQPTSCGIARSIVDDALKGRLDFMDGMVFYELCLQMRGLPLIIESTVTPAYLKFLHLPAKPTPAGKAHLMENLGMFRTSLEEFSGRDITPQSLAESIRVYNRNRGLLRRLYELRRKNPGLLGVREVVAIVQSSMLMLKEEHSELLEKLVWELERAAPASNKRVRVILSGCFCQAPRDDVLDMIEDAGAVVVDDDLFTGFRYFANDAKVNGDPLEALADRFLLKSPPDPTKLDPYRDWPGFLKEVVGRSGAQGVIHLLMKHCPPNQTHYPDLRRGLEAVGIPEMFLQLEHEAVSLVSMGTRIRAFIEVVGGV